MESRRTRYGYVRTTVKRISALLIILTSVCAALIAAEVGIRTYESVFRHIPFWADIAQKSVNILGWEGKQVFGDLHTGKYKILIIRDSFTDGNGLREDEMYYTQLKKTFDAELFVYGGLGYGTLQEYMILDRYVDAVKPDLILIQLTSNDIINNDFELERRSYFNNDAFPRPYYQDGNVIMKYPGHFGAPRYFLQKHSRLAYRTFYFIDTMLAQLASRYVVRSVEADIERFPNRTAYREATEITKTLFERMIARAGRTPIVFIPVDSGEPYLNTYREIMRSLHGTFVDQPAITMSRLLEEKPGLLQTDGAHLNARGNRYFGDLVVRALSMDSVFRNRSGR